jgi:hypothetical protein
MYAYVSISQHVIRTYKVLQIKAVKIQESLDLKGMKEEFYQCPGFSLPKYSLSLPSFRLSPLLSACITHFICVFILWLDYVILPQCHKLKACTYMVMVFWKVLTTNYRRLTLGLSVEIRPLCVSLRVLFFSDLFVCLFYFWLPHSFGMVLLYHRPQSNGTNRPQMCMSEIISQNVSCFLVALSN